MIGLVGVMVGEAEAMAEEAEVTAAEVATAEVEVAEDMVDVVVAMEIVRPNETGDQFLSRRVRRLMLLLSQWDGVGTGLRVSIIL